MATYNSPYVPQYVPQAYIPPQQPQNPIIWVKGEQEANNYLIAPNSTVPLWDSDTETIYFKQSDAAGRVSMKILKYTIEEPKTETNEHSNYVTKEDFESFADRLQKQLDKLMESKPKAKFKEE
jgi:hypothetical protein